MSGQIIELLYIFYLNLRHINSQDPRLHDNLAGWKYEPETIIYFCRTFAHHDCMIGPSAVQQMRLSVIIMALALDRITRAIELERPNSEDAYHKYSIQISDLCARGILSN